MITDGEIRLCAHCKGLGVCSTVSARYACLACLNQAGVPMDTAHVHYREAEGVLCSACRGKGNIWIGPDVVYGQAVTAGQGASFHVIKR